MLKKIILVLSLSLISITLEATQYTQSSCTNTWNQIVREQSIDSLYQPLIGLCENEFRKELKKIVSVNAYLSYNTAKKIIFSQIDNINGQVCGVYSGDCITTSGIPNANLFNVEHSWCQSWGATGTAKSDIHHLFPTKSNINSRRSNFPFCEVVYAAWEENGSSFGKSLTSTTSCFEPPDWHKGELARAMFYFALRYSKTIDSDQEEFFRKWNEEYPVSNKEYNRNEDIFSVQGNRNPFVLYPDFIKLISNF